MSQNRSGVRRCGCVCATSLTDRAAHNALLVVVVGGGGAA
jgi:hypothetical protein